MSGGEPELTMPASAPTGKNCAACGERFSCGAPAAGCWCEGLQVTREVLRELRARYSDCLCLRCLSAAASHAPHSDSQSKPTARNILPQDLL
jgi:hypothetical protein